MGARAEPLQLLARLMSSDAPPLAERVAGTPRYVSDAVQRALAKSPSMRFPTMDAALDAFEGRRASAPPPPVAAAPDTATLADDTAIVADDAAVLAGDALLARDAPAAPSRRGGAGRTAAIGTTLAALTVAAIRVFTPAGATARAAPATKDEAPRCASHRACTDAAGAPSRCVPRVGCAPLAAPGCRVLADPDEVVDDDTVLFGAVLSIEGAAAWGLRDLKALDLARRDFAQMMTTFTSGPAHGRVRRFGLVACDDGGGAARAVHHLVDELRVPAIVGFSSGAELIRLAGSTLIPSGTLVVAPFTTNPLLTTVPRGAGQPRLIYRTTYDSVDTARALGAAVPSIFEPELAKEGAVDGARPMRVALVRQRATQLSAFADAFFGAVRFNGRSALENGASYREITYDAAGVEAQKGYADVAAELGRFAPHAVVYVGDDAIVDGVIAKVEGAWREPSFRPRWLAISVIPPSAARFAAGDPSRRRRFFGISEVTSGPPNARFVLHYNEVYPEPIARSGGPNSSYDAFYVLAYATYAAGGADVTGESLARALPRLATPGKTIDVGPAAIFDAFSTLRGGGAIDLDGAASSLDFDLETGDVPVDQALLCLGDAPRGAVPHDVESGVVYDARARRLVGEMRCR